jgi:MtrB/PioB family decaheme-associated outer membrane protein
MAAGKQIHCRLYFALALLAFVPGMAQADNVAFGDRPPGGWACQSCLSATGWELDIEGGPATVNEDAFRFGDYTGLDESGVYLFGDIFGRYRDEDANYLVFEGYARGSDANALFVKGGKQSLYELRASYQAIPRRIFDSTITPYAGNGTNQLTLPQNWVRAPTTGQMTALTGTAAPVLIGWGRDIYGLGFDFSPTQRWKLRFDYTHQEREGLNRSSSSFLFNAVEFATPIDYASDDLEVALNYSADIWQVGVTYFGSVFSNNNSSLTWDNPYTALPGTDTGQLALSPDNESHQVSLAGSMVLPARTTVNGQLSLGHMTQNDDLLPYTTNTLLPTNPLLATSADAEVDTLNVNLRAVSSPWSGVTLEGELRYNDFDTKTPVNGYDYVVTDTVPASNPVPNTAYDYERREIKLRGEYRTTIGMKLYAGLDNERFERNRQDRSRTTTNRLWFRLRSRLGDNADIDLDLFAEDRDGSSYETVDNPAAPENPLMRKYNIADRERTGFRLHGSIFGGERSDFGWEYEYSKDSYNESAIGLTDSTYQHVGADLTYLLSQTASFYASVYNEQIRTDQRNSQSFSVPDWSATTDDQFTTVTMGVTYPGLLGPLDANIDYTWSQSVGETHNNTSGLPTSFPDQRSLRQNIRLGLSYPYSDSLSFGFDYFFESLDSDDWSLDGVNPDTIPNLLSLGANAWNYDASVFYFSVRYQL